MFLFFFVRNFGWINLVDYYLLLLAYGSRDYVDYYSPVRFAHEIF